jgi:hypothetical protein
VAKQENRQDPEDKLTPEELEQQEGEELPDREAMSVINPGVDGVGTIAPIEPPVGES